MKIILAFIIVLIIILALAVLLGIGINVVVTVVDDLDLINRISKWIVRKILKEDDDT